jgi:hypothetical protein
MRCTQLRTVGPNRSCALCPILPGWPLLWSFLRQFLEFQRYPDCVAEKSQLMQKCGTIVRQATILDCELARHPLTTAKRNLSIFRSRSKIARRSILTSPYPTSTAAIAKIRGSWILSLRRGNQETFLPRFIADSKTLDEWRQCGGLHTLLSYGLKPTISPDRKEQVRLAEELASAVPTQHVDFLSSLQFSFSCGDYLFVHAGIRPGIPINKQTEDDLLWIREEFLAHQDPFERFVVHGHTPVSAPDLRSNRLNIDTGAFATGRLTCMVIEGSAIMQLVV